MIGYLLKMEPSHRSLLVQDFLKTKLKRRFIRAIQWSPSSPDVNPLDYFYWDFVIWGLC